MEEKKKEFKNRKDYWLHEVYFILRKKNQTLFYLCRISSLKSLLQNLVKNIRKRKVL